VSADDKRRIHIHIRDEERTEIPAPETRPEFNIEVRDIRELRVSFRDQGSERKAKPYGMSGALISWDIPDAPPVDANDLRNTVLATRTPHTLIFITKRTGAKPCTSPSSGRTKKGNGANTANSCPR
jgi:hypothetical protein